MSTQTIHTYTGVKQWYRLVGGVGRCTCLSWDYFCLTLCLCYPYTLFECFLALPSLATFFENIVIIIRIIIPLYKNKGGTNY